jgi:NAD(P)-dependent dehydrogenase (short-subunit alcohol dehydrogenase family)
MGGLDGLVNNAGGLGRPVADYMAEPMAVENFDASYALNARPAIVAINAALPALIESKVCSLVQNERKCIRLGEIVVREE